MNVRDLIETLKELDPEATVLSEQVYNDDLDEVTIAKPRLRTMVTRKGCVNEGDTYWTDCRPDDVLKSFPKDDAEVRSVVVLR